MKKIILIFICIIFNERVFTQVTQRNILANKYSLDVIKKSIITKDKWHPYPTTSQEWVTLVPDSILKHLVKDGEKALLYQFEPISATVMLDFVRSGDRERHSKIANGKRSALMQLVIAESIEDKGRFMEAILNGIWSICEESYWGVPAHIGTTGLPNVEDPIVDLFSAETASLMALTDYFVGKKLDKINKLVRQRIYHETNVRIFVPMMKSSDKYGWMSRTNPVNNWNPWIMSNWILSNLLLEKNEENRTKMLYASMVGLDAYLNSLGEEGGCDEGPSYWFAAGGSVYDCLELFQNVTNNTISIFDNTLIQKMATYVYKTHIDGQYFVNFADAGPKLKPDGLMLYRFGRAIKDEKMVQFGKWAIETFPNFSVTGYQKMRKIENLLTVGRLDKSKNTYQAVKDAWINDIQVLTARSNNGLFLATHGGHNNESHNHNDVGDFIIYQNGQPMIIDAGSGNYTARTFSSQRYELWFTKSEYHNLPIINGFGQKAGREYQAKNVKCISNEKETTLHLDIADAYPKEAGINSWRRSATLNRQNNKVEISDEYDLAIKPKSLQQVFMTICQIDLSQKGKIFLRGDKNQTLAMNYDEKNWDVSIENPSTEGMEYSSFKTKWDNKPVTRILLTSKLLKQKGGYNISFESK